MDAFPDGILHLGGHGPLPDQLVELGLVGGHLGGHLLRGPETLPGRPDRFVGLLGVLDGLAIHPGSIGHVLRPIQLGDGGARRSDGALGERDAVGAHVGDVAVLVEALGHPHGARRREAQPAPGLLLKGGGAEGRVGLAGVGLALHRPDRKGRSVEVGGQGSGLILAQQEDASTLQLPGRVEVLPAGDPHPVHRHQGGGETVAVAVGPGELALDVPVRGRPEGHSLTLPFHEDAGSRALHASRRQLGLDLLPQDRRHLVTEQAIEHPPSLLGIDQPPIQVTGRLEGGTNGRRGDLVEHHPLYLHLGIEDLEEVPSDGLPFPVLVGGQIQHVGLLEQALEGPDLLLLLGGDDVQRLEVVLGVDSQASPLLTPHRLGHVGRVAGQVAHVADRRFHDEILAEEVGDGARLGGRLDDDEILHVGEWELLLRLSARWTVE